MLRQDLANSLSSARGLLFLVFFGVFWFWALNKLSGGAAQWLANPDGNRVAAWLLDARLAESLFQERAPTLSLYFLMAMSSIPLFVLVAACDQTANDIGSRYLRYLIPRCNRLEVYIARYLGALILVSLAYAAVTLAAAFVTLTADSRPAIEVFVYAGQIALVLLLYSMPFVALMSLCSAAAGSAGLSLLIGSSAYALLNLLLRFVGVRWPEVGTVLNYLLPNAGKYQLLALDGAPLATAIAAIPAYVLVYAGGGWLLFRRRDV